jgi:hypothetical protein
MKKKKDKERRGERKKGEYKIEGKRQNKLGNVRTAQQLWCVCSVIASRFPSTECLFFTLSHK